MNSTYGVCHIRKPTYGSFWKFKKLERPMLYSNCSCAIIIKLKMIAKKNSLFHEHNLLIFFALPISTKLLLPAFPHLSLCMLMKSQKIKGKALLNKKRDLKFILPLFL